MTKPVSGSKVPSDAISSFETTISSHPSINDFFGEEWLNENIRKHFENKFKVHPVFWIILQDENFPEKLGALNKHYARFESFITHLKNDRDNLPQLISNLNIFIEYFNQHADVEFQPLIPNSQKESDIKVVIDGKEYWGEILTINPDDEERLYKAIESRIQNRYNEENQTENCTSLSFKVMPENSYVDELTTFILENAKKIRLADGERQTINYENAGNLICEITYSKKGSKYTRGYYMGANSPVRLLTDDARIKMKILDKLKAFQFPDGNDISRFFVIILKGFADPDDVQNALLGQEYVTFMDSETMELRHSNGIVHNPQSMPLLNQIDFIIVNKTDGKKFYLLKDNSVDLDFVKKNF